MQEDFKPAKVPAFWSVETMVRWLTNPKGESFDAPPEPDKVEDGDGFTICPKRSKEPTFGLILAGERLKRRCFSRQ